MECSVELITAEGDHEAPCIRNNPTSSSKEMTTGRSLAGCSSLQCKERGQMLISSNALECSWALCFPGIRFGAQVHSCSAVYIRRLYVNTSEIFWQSFIHHDICTWCFFLMHSSFILRLDSCMFEYPLQWNTISLSGVTKTAIYLRLQPYYICSSPL